VRGGGELTAWEKGGRARFVEGVFGGGAVFVFVVGKVGAGWGG
jgi:hypothetical protein